MGTGSEAVADVDHPRHLREQIGCPRRWEKTVRRHDYWGVQHDHADVPGVEANQAAAAIVWQ